MDVELIFRIIAGAAATSILGLIVWQRVVTADIAVLKEKTKSIKENDTQAQDNLKSIHELEVSMLREFVRRDDYLSQISLFEHKLDAAAQMVARLDERVQSFMGQK